MTATEIFIYLAACASTGEKAQLDSVPFAALRQLASTHSMTAAIAKPLMETEAYCNADAEEQKYWRNAINNTVKRTMLFEAERKQIERFFEERGIWYIALKGAVINTLYRSYGTREFVDCDILYDSSFRKEVDAFFIERGYHFHVAEDDIVDPYHKAPFFNMEMHRTLCHPEDEDTYRLVFYREMLERKVLCEGTRYGYRMSDNDFYIYFIWHAYKHYVIKGTGFRTVMDEYAILHSNRFAFDFDFIQQELEKLGMLSFEQLLRGLADSLLSHPESVQNGLRQLSQTEKEVLHNLFLSGTFGSTEMLFANEYERVMKNSRGSVLRYYLRRAFPPIVGIKYTHPFIYKHKILYPFFWIYRMTVYPVIHRKYLKEEYQAIKRIDAEQ